MDGLDSLNVARCISDHAQEVISLFSVVTLYHSHISISVYGPRVSTGEHSWPRIIRIKSHYVSINCTAPPYWTRFGAAPEVPAFRVLTSWKTRFSDTLGKCAVFKSQDHWNFFQLNICWHHI